MNRRLPISMPNKIRIFDAHTNIKYNYDKIVFF